MCKKKKDIVKTVKIQSQKLVYEWKLNVTKCNWNTLNKAWSAQMKLKETHHICMERDCNFKLIHETNMMPYFCHFFHMIFIFLSPSTML